MGVRSTAKAIIIDNDKVLLNKCFDKNNGHYYSLPGGGQDKYESIYDAVIRECKEETGYNVIPERFCGIRLPGRTAGKERFDIPALSVDGLHLSLD